jgi:general secretion pathway protein F
MTLDDLVALNEEIAALVRAGVPLESGLAQLGEDLPGRLGRFVARLAERTARGESLAQAITEDAGQLQPAYRAVVEAGVRAGRLPAALEAVAASARRLADTRRLITLAAIYPAIVILAAWFGLLFFTGAIAPTFAAMFLDFQVPGQWFFAAMAKAGYYGWCWGPILPAIMLVLILAWWLGRAGGRRGERLFAWIPGTERLARSWRTATFLDLLALLVESQTPLPEAMMLAAEASGDPRTVELARDVTAALASGQTAPAGGSTFPPLVNWLLLAARRDGALLPAVRHAAAAYHRRARRQSDLLQVFVPIVLTIVVAGGVTALYALALFAPYVTMLRSMSG